MSFDVETIWLAIQEQLKDRLPGVIFGQWFAGAELLSVKDDIVELGVQNKFFKTRIESKYLDVVREAAEKALGRPVGVAVSISPKLFAAFRKTQETERAAEISPVFPDAMLASVRASSDLDGGYGVELNPDFCFSSFVSGGNARLAHAASLRAVENPGEYSPLYLFGQHGVGKTHLLQAICHEVRERHPEQRVLFTTGERFAAGFGASHVANARDEFRRAYTGCDCLIVDDVHILGEGRKSASKEELLVIIDVLRAKGKQIVFSASKAPGLLEGLPEKLKGRLESGLVACLDLPDEKMRRELAVRKLAERGVELPKPALAMLSRELSGSVRELEGVVKRLVALIQLERMEPTPMCIRMALDIAARNAPGSPLALNDVVMAVSEEYGIPAETLTGRSRTVAVRKARLVALLLCRSLIAVSLAELGRSFGNRNHATILSAMRRIPEDLLSNPLSARPLERILFRLGYRGRPEDLFSRQTRLFSKTPPGEHAETR